jgi:hypothetical protein
MPALQMSFLALFHAHPLISAKNACRQNQDFVPYLKQRPTGKMTAVDL